MHIRRICCTLLVLLGLSLVKTGAGQPLPGAEAVAAAQAHDHHELAVSLRQLVQQDDAQYSVYVDFLDGSRSLLFQNQQVRSASMIKVFILATAMEKEADGQLDESHELVLRDNMKVGGAGSLCGWEDGSRITIRQLLYKMITESDNTAANMLIDYLGMGRINQYIQQHGYTQTKLQRKMMDTEAVREGRENLTSARDLGIFFSRLYHRQCVRPDLDQKMIDILLDQEDTDVLPAACPGSRVAHKTGELDHLYHDGGIVYGPGHNRVIVILTENQDDAGLTLKLMKEIAARAEK
ncbi:serine hydrolase [Acidaminococcus sp.]|uniref:serine hydrolase n=1 Tax=Acidaminococcus sp. TaxID=1872103 RepID=UPI003D7E1AE6